MSIIYQKIAKRVAKTANSQKLLEEIRETLYDLEYNNQDDPDRAYSLLLDAVKVWYPDHFERITPESLVLETLNDPRNREPGFDYIREFIQRNQQSETGAAVLNVFSDQAILNIYRMLVNGPVSNFEIEQRYFILDALTLPGCKTLIRAFKPHLSLLEHSELSKEILSWGLLLLYGSLPDAISGAVRKWDPISIDRVCYYNHFLSNLEENEDGFFSLAQIKMAEFDAAGRQWGFTWEWAKSAPRCDSKITPRNVNQNYFAKITHPTGLTLWLAPEYGLKHHINIWKDYRTRDFVRGYQNYVRNAQEHQKSIIINEAIDYATARDIGLLENYLLEDPDDLTEMVENHGYPTKKDVMDPDNSIWSPLFQSAMEREREEVALNLVDSFWKNFEAFYALEIYGRVAREGGVSPVVVFGDESQPSEDIYQIWSRLQLFMTLGGSTVHLIF